MGEHRYAVTGTLTTPGFPTLTQANTSFNTTKSGWVVGGGAEWMATTNILLRAEYLCYSINNANVTASTPWIPATAAAGTLGFRIPYSYNFANYNVQVFRIAASYKF
jgi:opacity protein-like surface antigen